MKKKLALLMAAIMTVAMVPMTALAAAKTDITAVDQVKVAVDKDFTSRVELVKDEGATDIEGVNGDEVEVILTLENAKFTKNDDDKYLMDSITGPASYGTDGIYDVEVKSASRAIVTISASVFNGGFEGACTLEIKATALELGDVVAKFSTNNTVFADCSEVIATAVEGDVVIESAGVVTFVEDGDDCEEIKEITIEGLVPTALEGKDIVLKLKGDYEFCEYDSNITVDFLNDDVTSAATIDVDLDEITISFGKAPAKNQVAMMTISGIAVKTTKKTDVGDVAKINVISKDFDRVTLEVAKMVEEAVTYTVEDKKLPTIWAGADNYDPDFSTENTLKVSIEENTGDILNSSRKATFTFPEGIEVVDVVTKGIGNNEYYEVIDENVVTIRNYSKVAESDKIDMDIEFLLNAAPTFEGDVVVTLGGEFDDVEFTVATVKAPYTIEAKTSEVLIDYRYVPVNEIVITEAEEGILESDDQIVLGVEKMDFEDAGDFEVTEGDIEVDVDIDAYEDSRYAYLILTVEDDSTEASTIVISGLELYLDRTLPVGGYELVNVMADNILWDNSRVNKETTKEELGYEINGLFKYDDIVVNDSYVEVVTQARDQDDYSTSKKIVITIGAPTMTVGTQVINLTTPAYINAENFTELPLRAVSEAFGADVLWDDATKTVTIMMGQRIVSMTIGGRTMYVNGTPVAMSTAPEITNDFTFVPVRDLANALGISKIDWNEAAATVTLN